MIYIRIFIILNNIPSSETYSLLFQKFYLYLLYSPFIPVCYNFPSFFSISHFCPLLKSVLLCFILLLLFLFLFMKSIFITDSLLGCLWRCWWYKDCWAKTACEPGQAKTQGATGEICTWWLQRWVSYTILLVLIFVESGDRDDHRGYSRHSSRYWETNKAIMLAILCNILNDCRAFWAFWVTNYIL